LFLTWFYPTISGKNFSWLRWLSLGLIEILLIIPSALGNSLLHNITNYSLEAKLRSLWNLMSMMVWFGIWFGINFWLFSKMVILITSDKTFLWSRDSIHVRWSDQLLPFLGIILACSFIKQVYNYIFVATNKQNLLLGINGFGVVVWIGIGLWMIPDRKIGLGLGLFGAMITQMTMEVLFMSWAIITWIRHKVSPIMNTTIILQIILIMGWFAVIGRAITRLWITDMGYLEFFIIAGILNLWVIWASYKLLKRISRGLSVQESVEQIDPNEIVKIK
jgi:O-antigen/teichoic acid export membrane protein